MKYRTNKQQGIATIAMSFFMIIAFVIGSVGAVLVVAGPGIIKDLLPEKSADVQPTSEIPATPIIPEGIPTVEEFEEGDVVETEGVGVGMDMMDCYKTQDGRSLFTLSEEELSEDSLMDSFIDVLGCLEETTVDFVVRLESCIPSVGSVGMVTELVEYNIKGEKNGNCEIDFIALVNPNPDVSGTSLAGKGMSCSFSETERTIEDVYRIKDNCSGLLADAMGNFESF